jgi:predicted acylesterase/phospholipase RssA
VSRSPRIGLAISGGGFRATAFGLGCLRALHDRDLLRRVRVVSGISGGSVLASMWAYGPQSFQTFDDSVVAMLRHNLQLEIARRTFTPHAVVRNLTSLDQSLLTGSPRARNRTDSLVAAMHARPFGQRSMSDVTHPDLDTVISATDMASGNAMRFGSSVSGCSAYGELLSPATVSEAVAASAAFPLLLPALRREYRFRDQSGVESSRSVLLTDGGVYDNIGLSALMPGRSREYSSHTYELDYLIAADAGQGRSVGPAARFMLGRLKQSSGIIHTVAQDASRSKIHIARERGQIKGFVHTYLGMNDANLPIPVADLVRRGEVDHYRTDFAKMPTEFVEKIAVRAEQLTRVLLTHHCPDLA